MERTTNCSNNSPIISLVLQLLSTTTINGSSAAGDQNGGCAVVAAGETRKLFVFGDSYADTEPPEDQALCALLFKRDLERLHELGIPKVVVTRLHPIGFTPYLTREYNYTHGPAGVMRVVLRHNKMLQEMLRDLEESSSHNRSASSSKKTFLALNIYGAFMNVIRQANGARKFKYPLVPCCEGNSASDDCGDVEGEKQYTLCRHPEQHFYWDSVHPDTGRIGGGVPLPPAIASEIPPALIENTLSPSAQNS